MNKDYKYGVCYCENLDDDNPIIKHLKEFNNYMDAYDFYFELIADSTSYYDMKDWYIVFIRREDNMIMQFDRLKFESKCKLIQG